MTPLISVVLPVYNVEAYIKECIDSILNQTLQDFEVLVIDDCSTDNTINLIESYNDSRIKIKKKEVNKGLIDSLNLGFKLAKGTYIARMDGDDISALDRFQKQKDVLENNPNIDVCGCWLKQFGSVNKIVKHKEHHESIVANMLLSCSMSMGSVMLNKKAIEGYKFDVTKHHVEDYDFWSRIAWSCKLYNIQEVLYLHRLHKTQVSKLFKPIQIQGDIDIKLFLFKKLNYNADVYSDKIVAKMLVLNEHITVEEFNLFLHWIKDLTSLNKQVNVYSQKELEKVLSVLKSSIIFTLYFKKTTIGITKKWRAKALFKLPLQDLLWVLNLKRREVSKTLFK